MRKFVRRSLHVVLAGALLVTIYVIVLSIDREYQRTTDLGAGVTLIETVHVFRSAFTVIADSGGSAWIPVPSRSEGVIRQKLLRKGATLWERPAGKTYRASVSPNRQYLLLWDQVRTEWWRVYDLSTGTSREIYLPVHPGMGDGMVPLRFGRWSDDSRFIIVALDGEEAEPPHKWMRYRETYLLDPSNGNFYKQDHCSRRRQRPRPSCLFVDASSPGIRDEHSKRSACFRASGSFPKFAGAAAAGFNKSGSPTSSDCATGCGNPEQARGKLRRAMDTTCGWQYGSASRSSNQTRTGKKCPM